MNDELCCRADAVQLPERASGGNVGQPEVDGRCAECVDVDPTDGHRSCSARPQLHPEEPEDRVQRYLRPYQGEDFLINKQINASYHGAIFETIEFYKLINVNNSLNF